MLRMPLFAALLLALGMLGAGCNDGQQSTDGEHASNTSGGEDTSSSDDGELEAPPGSHQPDDDGLPDGDLESEADAQQGGSTANNGSPGAAQDGGEQASPWGRPESESGRPLPPRRPMNGSARSQYERGLQLASQGNASGAQQAFQAALSADSNAYMAAYDLGVLADRAGQEGRAMQYYQQALRIQPDYELAIEAIARIHVRRGNPADAVSFVQPLAQQWERNLYIQAILGDVLVQANRPEDGIEAARRALRRDERFVPAMVVLVKANLRLERQELAESILDQAIQTNNNNAELHYLRGRMYQEQGQLAPALESYRQAIQLEPAYTDARMALGLQQLAAGNYTDALAQFQTAAQLAPTLPAVHLALGDAYRSTRQWAQASTEYGRVQEMDPNSAQVHFDIGLMYLEAGAEAPGVSDAISAYQRAQTEMNRYRELRGPIPRGQTDPADTYLEELGRLIEREQRAIERERARQEREAARAARQAAQAQEQAAQGGDAAGGTQ